MGWVSEMQIIMARLCKIQFFRLVFCEVLSFEVGVCEILFFRLVICEVLFFEVGICEIQFFNLVIVL